MTAPRQEPSTKRDIVGLGWGERQLARRPAPMPPSTGAIVEWGVVAGTNTVTVASGGTGEFIDWENDYTPPGNTIVDSYMVSDTKKPWTLTANGWYSFWWDIEWTGVGFTDVRTYWVANTLADNTSYSYSPTLSVSSPIFASGNGAAGPLYIRGAELTVRPQLKVYQSTGVGKDLATGFFTAIYWGDTAENPSDFWP